MYLRNSNTEVEIEAYLKVGNVVLEKMELENGHTQSSELERIKENPIATL